MALLAQAWPVAVVMSAYAKSRIMPPDRQKNWPSPKSYPGAALTFSNEHIHTQRTYGDEMAIVHIVERLNSFLDTTFEIDAARTGLVETKGHFLRAMAGERAMPCARRLCRFTVFVMSVSMLISFVAGSAADNAAYAAFHPLRV